MTDLHQTDTANPPPDSAALPAPVRRNRPWRMWVLVAALILLGVVGWQTAGLKRERASLPPAPPPVRHLPVVEIRRGDVDDVVKAVGKVQLLKYVDINPAVAGQLGELRVSLGETVQAGAALSEIAPTVQTSRLESDRATLARLQADLAGQQAQYEFADLQFKRQSQLKAENATRQESYESSRMSLASAAAKLDAIKAQIRQTESSMKDAAETRRHTQLKAPFSGVVVSLNARPGQMVGSNPNAPPLFRIADLSRMQVEVRVGETSVTRLSPGNQVYFTTPGYPDSRWYGHLRQIVPIPASGTGDFGHQTFYNALFEVDNPGNRLLGGMTANANFVLAQRHNVLIAPAALVTPTDQSGVAQVDTVIRAGEPGEHDRVLRQEVRTGLRNDKLVEIVSGLKAGELLLDQPIISNRPEPRPVIYGDPGAAPPAARAVDAESAALAGGATQ